ncbi:MAG: hypothetical protein H6841_05425 [Planctomycetes bacterium]|nr:hypothetical protein [Planctomycetota bacterium]MCB9935054.1 hypothetical protein [Planctomycetota bacterium]
MTWQPYAMAAFAVVVLAALFGLAALTGFEHGFTLGAAIGFGASLVLMLLNEVTTRLALKEQSKTAAMGHILGGFLLRIVVLAAGFLALAFTGFANPAAFALAFLGGVLLMLGVQVFRTARGIQRARAQTA